MARGTGRKAKGKDRIILAVLAALLLFVSPVQAAEQFITLTYHDIPETPVEKDDISQKDFINQIEYLRSHGFAFVSPADILAASRGERPLPEKAVLITFDDAYESFYRFVFPVLRLYNIPAVLSVVTSWIDNPETSAYKSKRFMSWPQIREVADSGLVTVASHSSRLHRLLQVNPVGNIEPAPAAFLYFPEKGRYETEAEFRARIREDLAASIDTLTAKLGRRPTILTWPYGSYNEIGVEEAKKLGFEMILTLDDGYSSIRRLDRVNRYYLETHLDWLAAFKDALKRGLREDFRIRGVQVDLDLIVSKNSMEESNRNLGLLLDRLVRMGVNTVFLQGFCDVGATGNVKSLYFANSVLPVDLDFLSHAVNRIRSREMKVFVWMPALAYELPETALNEELKVREWKGDRPGVTSSWYRRLSPFDPRSLEAAKKIFSDLAARVQFDGILIQDDAYLAETEDFHPAAIEAFRRRYGVSPDPQALKADRELGAKWVAFKTEALDLHVDELVRTVRAYRPGAAVGRNLYSSVVTNPEATRWFAQDLRRYLERYDYTVIMAYAAMEGQTDRRAWYRELFRAAGGINAADRLVFKLQAYDWKRGTWLGDAALKDDLTFLLALGVRHVAYYPDNVYLNRPDADTIASILSARDEVKRKESPPAIAPEGALERLFRKLFSPNP
ncbi:MAG: poly-beta-1,6-N-acetyl-D-glucosamine N-deacetylase PgaB [Syntrophaceae bacterium]|nr:poly-beta-1,6-N-acetyl-D-glucosamine N-deacetylase PgaB [Syntrophaceae bacterium]